MNHRGKIVMLQIYKYWNFHLTSFINSTPKHSLVRKKIIYTCLPTSRLSLYLDILYTPILRTYSIGGIANSLEDIKE